MIQSQIIMKAVIFIAFLHLLGTRATGLKSEVFKRTSAGEKTQHQNVDIRCAQLCLRQGFGDCSYIKIDTATSKCNALGHEVSEAMDNRKFEIVFQDGGFRKVVHSANYKEASEGCRRLKGSLASYEQLVSAIKYGKKMTCDQCWLISGEITFSNNQIRCKLNDPDTRFNLYPDRNIAYSCFYCYLYTNLPPDKKDYHARHRLLHLKYDKNTGYIYTEAERRCQREFGGHLALPIELYNATVAGVDVACEKGWFSNGMRGKCYKDDHRSSWSNALTGTDFLIPEHHDNEKKLQAYCFLSKYDTETCPYPPHGVIHIKGKTADELNYIESYVRCVDIGGYLAARDQIEEAYYVGYTVTKKGWINGSSLVEWCKYSAGCKFRSNKNETEKKNAYCYIPQNNVERKPT